jgi:hypothetical protein
LALASDRFRDNMDKLGAALNGLKVTIIGPLVSALATLTEQFLRSDLFASIRAQIDALASSGKLEEWAKRSVFFVIDAFTTMTRSLAILFPVAAAAVVEAMRTITSAVSSGLATLTVVFGNMTISIGAFLDNLASIPFIGRVFEGLGSQVRIVGGDVVNAMHQASQSLQQFSQNLAVPQGVNAVAKVLENVAISVQNFGARAKASFETVKSEITRTTSKADVLTQPLDEATTSTGELVQVSGGVGVMFDRATGKIVAMNRELFGALTLVRQINAEAVNPVQ